MCAFSTTFFHHLPQASDLHAPAPTSRSGSGSVEDAFDDAAARVRGRTPTSACVPQARTGDRTRFHSHSRVVCPTRPSPGPRPRVSLPANPLHPRQVLARVLVFLFSVATESDSSSSTPRVHLPSHKVIHGYASSDSDGGNHPPPAYNILATDTYDMGLTPAAQHAARRSDTVRHSTARAGRSRTLLYYLVQSRTAHHLPAAVGAARPRRVCTGPLGRAWTRSTRATGKQNTTMTQRHASCQLLALPPRSRESRAIRAVLGAAGRRTLETGPAEA